MVIGCCQCHSSCRETSDIGIPEQRYCAACKGPRLKIRYEVELTAALLVNCMLCNQVTAMLNPQDWRI